MALTRVRGTSRYVDTDTGETISRRQYEKQQFPGRVEAREARYRSGLEERRQTRETIIEEIGAEQYNQNKRYWLQRFSEQYAGRRGMTDREAREIQRQPGSEFNRLWARAEAQGFDGGQFSAWDALTWAAGARGGAENEHERSKYLAVIAWYMNNDEMAEQAWLEKDDDGRFTWPGMAA